MPDGNPLVAQAPQDGNGPGPLTAGNGDYGYAGGIGIAESAMDSFNGIKDGDWVGGGLGVLSLAGEAASAAIDPFGYLMSSVASFLMEHIQPLKDMLDSLAGDPPVIQSYSETWANVAKSLEESQVTYANAVKNGTTGWTGSAADAYRKQATEQADALAGAATAASTISTVVMIMGEVVAFVREFVRDLIADLVGKLIAWVLETVFSLGFGTPVVVAQAVTAISAWAVRIADKLKELLEAIRRVSPLLGKLGDVFAKILKVLGKIAGKVTGLDVISTKSIKGSGFATRGGGGGSGGSHGGGTDGPDGDGGSGSGSGDGGSGDGGSGSGDGGSGSSGDSGSGNGSGDGSSGGSGSSDTPSSTRADTGSGDSPSSGSPSNARDSNGSPSRSGDSSSPAGDGGSPSHAGDGDGSPARSGSPSGAVDSGSPSRTSDSGSPSRAGSDSPSHAGDSSPSPARSADAPSPARSADSPSHTGDSSPSPARSADSPSHTGDNSPSPARSDSPSHTGDNSPSPARSDSPSHPGDSSPSRGGDSPGSGSPSHAGGGSPSPARSADAPSHSGSPSHAGDGSPAPRPADSTTSASGLAPSPTPRTDPGPMPSQRGGGDGSPSGLPPQGQPMAGGMPPGGAPGGAPGGSPGGMPGGRAPGGGWTGTPGSPGAPTPRTPDVPGPRTPDTHAPRTPDPVARGPQAPTHTAPGTHGPGNRPGGPGRTGPGNTGPGGHSPDGNGPGGPHRDTPDSGSHSDPDGSPHHDQPERPTPDEVNQRHSESTPAGSSYHRADADMGDLPHRVQPDPDGRHTVDVHVTPDGHARIGNQHYTPEEFADILRRNGDYDGRPIRLIGCDAGSNDFAKRLSRELDTEVMAPSKPAWTDSNGRVFSSDYEVGPDGKMRPRIPPNGEWDVHSPDGTSHRASDDGFTPDTSHADKQDVDAESARDRGDSEPPDRDDDTSATRSNEPPDADGPRNDSDASRAQEERLRDGDHQDTQRANPQHASEFSPSSAGDPVDVRPNNPAPDAVRPPRVDEPFPTDQPLGNNRRYEVYDEAGNRRGTYHTDSTGRVTHIDTEQPNVRPRNADGTPNPDYRANPDVAHPHPDTTYRVEVDGHSQTYHTDPDGLPHPRVEFHRPDFVDADGNPVDPVRVGPGEAGPPPPRPQASFADRTDLQPNTRYEVLDTNGNRHGTYYTDSTGQVRWAEVESGRIARQNPDLTRFPDETDVRLVQRADPDATAPHGVDNPQDYADSTRQDAPIDRKKSFFDTHPPDSLQPNTRYVVTSDYPIGDGKVETRVRGIYWTDANGNLSVAETFRPHHPDLNKPQPNRIYSVDDGRFVYETGPEGPTPHGPNYYKTNTVAVTSHDYEVADSRELSRRDETAQKNAGGIDGKDPVLDEDGNPTGRQMNRYDGGHIAGNQFRGPGELTNMLSQWRLSNQGQAGSESWYAFEQDLAGFLGDPHHMIERVDTFALRDAGDRVPHTLQVRWVETVTDADGNAVRTVRMRSFPNTKPETGGAGGLSTDGD